jgi:hypothetical protein
MDSIQNLARNYYYFTPSYSVDSCSYVDSILHNLPSIDYVIFEIFDTIAKIYENDPSIEDTQVNIAFSTATSDLPRASPYSSDEFTMHLYVTQPKIAYISIVQLFFPAKFVPRCDLRPIGSSA